MVANQLFDRTHVFKYSHLAPFLQAKGLLVVSYTTGVKTIR